jgi:hypothetical protein
VAQVRRALFSPLEEALLLGYFSRLEEQRIITLIVGNAKALQNRFGEDAADILQKQQQNLLSNIKTLYRQLARTHHPDLERDPTAQQHKMTLMQRITEAYEANDLYALLQLLNRAPPARPTTRC